MGFEPSLPGGAAPFPMNEAASFDACAESLMAASRALERELQSKFAQDFFQSMLGLTLSLDQSYDAWKQVEEVRRKLAQDRGAKVSFRQALLEYFLHSPHLRDPVVTEFGELQRLRLTSTIDHLTGTNNRRNFDDALAREVPRAGRYGHELSLTLMDLNRFKEVNDTHGHDTGDQLLALSGKLLIEVVRTSDEAFRIGGDEFALLLPQTAFSSALILAERIRQTFGEKVRPLDLKVPVSIAYGIATSPREAKDAKALFTLADQRMYDFKRSIGSPRCAPRRFKRIPVEDSDAHVVLRAETESHRGDLLDFSFGGVGLRVPSGISLPEVFVGDLHLRVLPPVSVQLRKVHSQPESQGMLRVGCSFAQPIPGGGSLPSQF